MYEPFTERAQRAVVQAQEEARTCDHSYIGTEHILPAGTLGLVLIGLVFLLFPDGRPPSPRWRWVLWTYAGIGLVWIAWTAVITVGAVLSHHPQVDSAGQLFLVSGDDPAAGWWNTAYTGIFRWSRPTSRCGSGRGPTVTR